MDKKRSKVIDKGKELSNEFKTFALSGATIGAAVGIVMGTALTAMISSFVKDVLTPPIAYLTSGIDFTNLYWVISGEKFDTLAQAQASGLPIIYYGNFLTSLISFLITALALFLLTKVVTGIFMRSKKS